MHTRSLVVIVLVASARPAGSAEPSRVRVMTFNIRYATDNYGEDKWANRREMVAELPSQQRAVREPVAAQAVAELEALRVTGRETPGFVAVAELAVAERVVGHAEPGRAVEAEPAVVHVDRGKRSGPPRSEQL